MAALVENRIVLRLSITNLLSLEENPLPVPGCESEELIPSLASESPEVTAREPMEREFLFFTRIPFRAGG